MLKRIDTKLLVVFGSLLAVLLLRRNLGDVWLGVGWIIGYFLSDFDHLYYIYVTNPHELTSQRIIQKFSWGLFQESKSERTNLILHNPTVLFILGIFGLWTVTSSGSLLAIGAILSLNLCLSWEMKNKLGGLLLLLQLFFLVR
ncbi:MAG: hypothetical protein AAB550_00885 [Patescibacteria group bacterium]